jgi:hypothetical protein
MIVPQNLADRELDILKLRHDFANDIGSLKMSVEVLRLVRENPDEFEQLITLMQETVSTLESRLMQSLDAMIDSVRQSG